MMEPFDYTGKWVVGPKTYREAFDAEISRANRLKGGGQWYGTRKLQPDQLAALEGGRYEARYGAGWRDEVAKVVAKGDHGYINVTELMDHAIAQGNEMFKNTPYANTWWIFDDHLSAWWSTEAQEYLASKGFRDRKVRAWGDTNSQFSRYHESLVGNRPEMCPLDFHLFEDIMVALHKNIMLTSSLPSGPADDPCAGTGAMPMAYGAGSVTHLAESIKLTLLDHPSSERICEDIQRWASVLDLIVEHKGSLVPDAVIHRTGCRSRT